MPRSADEVMDTLGDGLRTRNVAAIRALYADDVRIWHASTAVEQGKEENLAFLASIFTLVSELEYRDVQRHLIDGGVVQQHCVAGVFLDGSSVPDLHACVIVKLRDGQIARVEEYFSADSWAEVWARLEPPQS